MSPDFLLPPKNPDKKRNAAGSRVAPVEWTTQQELVLWPVCASVSSLSQLSDAVKFLAPLVDHVTRCGIDQKLTGDQLSKNQIDMFLMRLQTRHMGASHNSHWPSDRRDRFHSWSKSLWGPTRSGAFTWGEKYLLEKFRGKKTETSWKEDVRTVLRLLDRDPRDEKPVTAYVDSKETVCVSSQSDYLISYGDEATGTVNRFLESDRDTDLPGCLKAWAAVRSYFSPPPGWGPAPPPAAEEVLFEYPARGA